MSSSDHLNGFVSCFLYELICVKIRILFKPKIFNIAFTESDTYDHNMTNSLPCIQRHPLRNIVGGLCFLVHLYISDKLQVTCIFINKFFFLNEAQ